MQEESRIVGIDLGTTNSVLAIMEGSEPLVVPNQEGANKTPSVVAFLDDNECIVGEIARRQAATNPERTISSIKRLMGADYEEVEARSERFPFKIVDYEDRVLIDINGLGYSPEQISALVLKKLKESAENYLGEEVKQAVITVPANFDDRQRSATIEAARLAGLEVLRLLNEPTAAALAYGLGRESDDEEVIAVYDFGGGTFDITVLEVTGKTFEVLTTTGDASLGGDDLDNEIVNMIVAEFEEEHGVDLTEDPVTLRRLKEVAEKAKCELSTATQTMIALPFIAYRDGQPLHLERQLLRDEFEELIEPYVNRTIRCCKRALEEAGLSKSDLHKVILVGGSTRIPLVQDLVDDFFGLQPFKGINPDEVVALGAATQAGVFSGNIEEVTLLDVAPHSLGIEVKDGKFSRIIEKNATIPIKAAKNFTTTEDNQTFVNIHILQGESSEAAENRSLGKFILSDIPSQQKGVPRVRVTFFMNADGVMEISAEELSSSVSKSLTIVHSDLDESEKKQRRKARQKRRGGRSGRSRAGAGGRSSGSSSSSRGRYSVDTTGEPLELGTGSGAGHSSDSSVVRRKSDSDIHASEENFAMLGDTTPGLVPTSHLHQRPSREAIDLQRTSGHQPTPATGSAFDVHDDSSVDIRTRQESGSGSYPAPKRYGAAAPMNENLLSPEPAEQAMEEIPVPPDEPPIDEAETTLEPPEGLPVGPGQRSDTVAMTPDTPQDPTGRKQDTTTSEDFPTLIGSQLIGEEIELPGIVDSALELAVDGDESADAMDMYGKAMQLLNRQTWTADERYGVLRARTLLQMMLGQLDEMRASLQALAESAEGSQHKDVLAIFDRSMRRFAMPVELRRDRARIREKMGDLEGACEDLEYASKMEPQDGDMETLENLYRARIDRNKDSAARFKLVKVYLKTNRVDDAIEILQELQHEQNYETRALKILGLCHWQKNLHFLAWQKFKHLRLNDEICDILYRLGSDMETTGQLNNALVVYEHIAEEKEEYRDVIAKIKKLRYRIKIQQEEAEQSRASVLSDPRFVIIEEINRGSMGIIYKARDKTLEEVVALKVLNDYLCADPSAVERFKREARAAKKLSHPYIVRIHDMFESNTKRFISMEYIQGTDMKRKLAEGHKFREDELTFYFMQICDALSYAHKLNIIHRDIKPANVMITNENHVKVTDFGIAKILKGDDSTKSGTAVIGTPLYMAPEQITGEGVDARTDIYSLGIMMYELVSGHPPFYLGNIEYHHIHTAPPPLPDHVSNKMGSIIMKCVEKNPANRFQHVDEIFNALNVQG